MKKSGSGVRDDVEDPWQVHNFAVVVLNTKVPTLNHHV